MKTTIFTNGIVKETEKAILVKALVTWNDNGYKEREIWMPKSVVTVVDDARKGEILDVEDWFIDKLSAQNAFHGYRMSFDRPIA